MGKVASLRPDSYDETKLVMAISSEVHKHYAAYPHVNQAGAARIAVDMVRKWESSKADSSGA